MTCTTGHLWRTLEVTFSRMSDKLTRRIQLQCRECGVMRSIRSTYSTAGR